MPFLFSLPPRRHELCGSAKYVAMPGSSRSSACRANSVPSSCVTPVRAAAGSRENMAFCAATLAAAVLSGTIAAMGKRVRRSTSVCRLQPVPMTPSARRSRLALSAYTHRQTASGRQRITGPPECSMARRPHIGSGDRPRRNRSATHVHRRPDARRRGLRATASRRMALRRAGPATWQRPVHGPVLSRLGRHGRHDSLSSDGNHVSRLISRPTADACRPRIMAMRRTPAPLPISIRMTCRSSSDRREYTWPKVQHPFVWLSGQSPI